VLTLYIFAIKKVLIQIKDNPAYSSPWSLTVVELNELTIANEQYKDKFR